MKIVRYPVGQLQANCYLLIEDKECIIVDPGDEASFLLEEIQRKNLNLHALIATHGHFDHIMAVGEIQMSFDVPFYISKKDKFLVERVGETAKYFLKYEPNVIPSKTTDLPTREFQISEFKFQIISTPGHTPGSSCFYFEEEKKLFTGDTLFADGVGRYDFKYADKKLLADSIKRLYELPGVTTYYSGHGEESTIETAKRLKISP